MVTKEPWSQEVSETSHSGRAIPKKQEHRIILHCKDFLINSWITRSFLMPGPRKPCFNRVSLIVWCMANQFVMHDSNFLCCLRH